MQLRAELGKELADRSAATTAVTARATAVVVMMVAPGRGAGLRGRSLRCLILEGLLQRGKILLRSRNISGLQIPPQLGKGLGNGVPVAANSWPLQPSPTPAMKRPFDSRSTAAPSLAK